MTLPHITKLQKQILLILYRFRFLTRLHIQKILKHNDHKYITDLLNDLTEKGYIACKKEEPKFGRKPNVYNITKNGIKFLKSHPDTEKTYLAKLYQEDRRSEGFKDRSSIITEAFLSLLEQTKDTAVKLKFYTPSDFKKNGTIQKIKPSFAYIKETDNEIENYICEFMIANKPWVSMSGRIEKYLEFFGDEDGITNIIFICPDARLYRSVGRFTRKKLREEDYNNLKLYQTTYERMRKADLGERIEIK